MSPAPEAREPDNIQSTDSMGVEWIQGAQMAVYLMGTARRMGLADNTGTGMTPLGALRAGRARLETDNRFSRSCLAAM